MSNSNNEWPPPAPDVNGEFKKAKENIQAQSSESKRNEPLKEPERRAKRMEMKHVMPPPTFARSPKKALPIKHNERTESNEVDPQRLERIEKMKTKLKEKQPQENQRDKVDWIEKNKGRARDAYERSR